MKRHTIFLTVRVVVKSEQKISSILAEMESKSVFSVSETSNVEVQETEILVSRLSNFKNVHYPKSSGYEVV